VKKPRIKHAAARKLQPQQITQGEIDAILRRLTLIDEQSKRFGDRMGLVGENGIKVFRYLAGSFPAKGWACFPSYKHIAAKTRLARSTVSDALARLKRLGALTWMQRRNGRRQGTNVFRIHMPPLQARLLPVLKRVRQKAVDAARKVAAVVADVARQMSETGERPQGATTDRKNCGAASPRTVSDASGAPAMPPQRVSSEENGAGSRLIAALERLERGVAGGEPRARRLAVCLR